MRTGLWAALMGLMVMVPVSLHGQGATITGRVVDAQTGEPLAGAHVFIAASTRGTATDEAGRFALERVPHGGHRLFVSMLGYASASSLVQVRADTMYRQVFKLTAVVLEAGELTVEGERDPRWPRRLRRFRRLFLGETPHARQVRLLNPEVLDFEATWWGRLRATAAEPLVIENEALGYRIYYHLKEFISEGHTIKYDGEPLYEEMVPTDTAQAALWARNRRAAYYGSFRHFLLTLLAGNTAEEGFETYRRLSLEGLHRDAPFPYPPETLLAEGPGPTEMLLQFDGFIEIRYTREDEDPAFHRWQGLRSERGGPQRSWIKLTEGPTVVDLTGEVLDPYGVTVYGYFAFERVADEVPKEYRPDTKGRLPTFNLPQP